MKKKALLSEAIWVFEPDGLEMGPAVLVPAATNDTLVIDEGEPLPLLVGAGDVTGLTVGAAKPVASIAQLADYLVNGFWQYNGTIAHRFASNTITYNINALNSAEQFLAVSAMQAWHDVANINFVQTSGAANLTFSNSGSMQAYTSAAWYSSGAIAYANIVISSDWITNDGGAYDGKTGIDSYGYQTYIHEIGHALGLGHQGPYNGSASYSTNAIYANDTWQYSIMSYFSENNYSGSSYRYVVTPQMADIYAMGSMYGAASATRTGDTVYGFNSNAGAVFNFSAYSPAPALTIYDSGGNDTLDCSGYSNAQIIDLRAGSFSSVGGLVNNIGIALNAVIEKAIGGAGNDTLIANSAGSTLLGGGGNDALIGGAGSDRLIGGAGVDTLTGGGAADTFVFLSGDSSAASGQHDRIEDFTTGVDRIDLTGFDAITSTSTLDAFRFMGATPFGGSAGELNCVMSLGVLTLQGDTNGDGIADFAIDLTGNATINAADLIGAVTTPIVIEAFGSTSLTKIGSTYFLYNAGSGPELKFDGAPVTDGMWAGWAPIGAEQTAAGYNVAWKNAGTGQYNAWSADSSGNYITNTLSFVSASSTALQSIEATFQQDLNGDGRIGVPTVVIESAGSTSLTKIGSTYFLYNAGAGPELKFGGAPVTDGKWAGWAPIGAERTAAGYNVAWKNAGTGQYNVWSTDSSGNYITNTLSLVSASSTALQSIEGTFQQDLNGDGRIGVPTVVIESAGSTSLTKIGSTYFLHNAGSGPELKFDGAPVTDGMWAGWAPIGAEQTAAGYNVAWKNAGTGQYNVWSTDSSGNYITNTLSFVSASSTALQSIESKFQQDLNDDGRIGVPTVVIESAGSTSLTKIGSTYFLHNAGSGPELKFDGAPVTDGMWAGWAPIGAEQTAAGYNVAWKNAGTGQYNAWSTDSSANYITNTLSFVSASSTALQSLETSFQQDLNGDGTIGVHAALLQAGSANGDNFVFKADLLAPGADVTDSSFDIVEIALHSRDQASTSGETSIWLAPVVDTPDGLAEDHWAGLKFGHFIVQ
jgi:serralysin